MYIYLQDHAVICRSLIFALVVLAKIDINMIQLQETHQVSGCLNKNKEKLTEYYGSSVSWQLIEMLSLSLSSHGALSSVTSNCAKNDLIDVFCFDFRTSNIFGNNSQHDSCIKYKMYKIAMFLRFSRAG